MTTRTIRASTETHARISLLLVPALLGIGVATTTEPLVATVAVAVLLVVVAMAAMPFGTIAGGFVGLIAAGLDVLAFRWAGTWDLATYPAGAVIVACSVGMGLLAGSVGSMLRDRHSAGSGWADALPIAGSLGLLHPSMGEARLDEEIERARYAEAPLSVLRLRVSIAAEDLDLADRVSALRAVSRSFESLLHLIHVAFAYSDDDLVAILPETPAAQAWALAEEIRELADEATVMVGQERERRRFAELGTTRVGVSTFRINGHNGPALLEAAVPGVGYRVWAAPRASRFDVVSDVRPSEPAPDARSFVDQSARSSRSAETTRVGPRR